MALTYNDISALVASFTASLQEQEKTEQEIATELPGLIATALADSGVTKQPVNRANLLFLLNMRGMLTKLVNNNSDEKWTGTVLNMQDAIIAAGTDEQKAAIRTWLSHITNPTNIIWDTTDQTYAKPFLDMVTTFAGVTGMPTADDFQAVVDLGGGYKFAGVDAAAVQAVIDAHQRSELIADWAERFNSALNKFGTAEQASGVTDLRAIADEMEAA